MKAIQATALAFLFCLPMACKGGEASHSSDADAFTATEWVYLDGESSLSARITKTAYNSKKITVEMVFQNNGDAMVHFPLDGVIVEVDGINVVAKGFLGASMEKDIDLLPGTAKPRKYGFHTLEFGAGAPHPGSYTMTVRNIMDHQNELIGKDLVIPFEVR